MYASQEEFIMHTATALGWFYVVATALNVAAVLYAWRNAGSRLAALVWLLAAAMFGGLAFQAFRGYPLAMPEAGPPWHTSNPRPTGLRSWHVKGFDEFRVY